MPEEALPLEFQLVGANKHLYLLQPVGVGFLTLTTEKILTSTKVTVSCVPVSLL